MEMVKRKCAAKKCTSTFQCTPWSPQKYHSQECQRLFGEDKEISWGKIFNELGGMLYRTKARYTHDEYGHLI